ncbi:hypothetical protein [Lentzea sp. E54]
MNPSSSISVAGIIVQASNTATSPYLTTSDSTCCTTTLSSVGSGACVT